MISGSIPSPTQRACLGCGKRAVRNAEVAMRCTRLKERLAKLLA